MNENLRHIPYYQFNETILHPIAVVFVLLMVILILRLPRRAAILPMIATALYITNLQRIVVGGLDFDMMRIAIMAGMMRVFLRSEYASVQINAIDKTIIWFVIVSIITGTILGKSFGAFVNRIGFAFSVLGVYFLSRVLINEFNAIDRVIIGLAILSVPVAIAMSLEQVLGENLFSIFGGVPEHPMIRSGRLRSQGALPHPILAGSFGAALIPLMWGLWCKDRRYRKFAVIGAISATVITITSASSGPVFSYASGILGLVMWKFRKYMRILLYGGFFSLVALHMVMKAPVWALMWRIAVVGGSTGYHRYLLIDQAIRRIGEWWLVGSTSMGSWHWGLQDVTNQFVRVGVNGGLLTLTLFVIVIILCFKTIGHAVRENKDQPFLQKYIWAIGVSLFTHVVSFMGVSYFGQAILFWYLTVAIIANIRSLELTDK